MSNAGSDRVARRCSDISFERVAVRRAQIEEFSAADGHAGEWASISDEHHGRQPGPAQGGDARRSRHCEPAEGLPRSGATRTSRPLARTAARRSGNDRSVAVITSVTRGRVALSRELDGTVRSRCACNASEPVGCPIPTSVVGLVGWRDGRRSPSPHAAACPHRRRVVGRGRRRDGGRGVHRAHHALPGARRPAGRRRRVACTSSSTCTATTTTSGTSSSSTPR